VRFTQPPANVMAKVTAAIQAQEPTERAAK
jgi:hypothetical protein